jgi:membrane-associated protein
MNYLRFLAYSIGGTIAWTGTFVLGGYFFGNIAVVNSHFTIVIMAIIVISLMPGVIAFIRQKTSASPDAKK